MKKIFSFLLAFFLLLTAFPIPSFAEETITDLKKVFNNLTAYLYTPYYENSEYFQEYQRVMAEAEEVINSDDITQDEISKYYNAIRKAYSDLMKDTYDYSSLEQILKGFDSLDGSIFTEESWKKVLSVRDAAKKELDSPSLFSRTENMSAESYANYINRHIRTFTNDFKNAFNRLIFVDPPEAMTPEYLTAFMKLIRFCARGELLGETAGWNELQEAFAQAEKDLALRAPKAEQLLADYNNLLSAYFNVCNAGYDFTASREALTAYQIMTSHSFSKDSWERYANTAKALEDRLTKPHFFYIPYEADKEVCEKYAKDYLSALPSVVLSEQENLIPMEKFNELKSLCDKYRNKTSMEGLDIKLNLLKTRVSEGDGVLANKDATLKDVENAIKNIETAHNDLILAEGHLLEEQGKVVKQDAKTSRYTILFFIGTVVISAALAPFLSKFFHGKVNWSK